MEVLASASLPPYWQFNVTLLDQRAAYSEQTLQSLSSTCLGDFPQPRFNWVPEMKFQCDNIWTLAFQQDNQGKTAKISKILHFNQFHTHLELSNAIDWDYFKHTF